MARKPPVAPALVGIAVALGLLALTRKSHAADSPPFHDDSAGTAPGYGAYWQNAWPGDDAADAAAPGYAGYWAPEEPDWDALYWEPAMDAASYDTGYDTPSAGALVMGSDRLTRGERNNNPGNIVKTDIAWQGEGLPPGHAGFDSRFEVFTAPEYGIRALGRLLQNYSRAGRRSVQAIINTYAPPAENDTGAYVRAVAARLNVNPNAELNLFDPATLRALVSAIITHENGRDLYTDAGLTDTGLSMM